MNNLIYKYISGSYLYGTSVDGSDTDIRGVFIAGIGNYFGLERVESFKYKDMDIEYYEIKKYIRLLIDNNPNILEGLFVNEDNVLLVSDEWNKIKKNYSLFLDKEKIYRKFLAYAHSQKKKMIMRTGSYNDMEVALDFLNNLSDNFSKSSIIDILKTGRSHSVFSVDGDEIKVGDMFVSKQDSVKTVIRKIRQRLGKFSKRKELISKYGYDTKFAMHLIRLLYEGIELLQYERICFPLTNKDFLLKIRKGEYDMEKIINISYDLEEEFKYWYKNTNIGKSKFNEVNKLLIDILKSKFCI